MNKEQTKVLAVFTAVVAGAALLLTWVQANYKLGDPGVKIGHVPLYDEHTNLIAQTSVLVPAQLPGYTSSEQPVTSLELNWLPPDTTYGRRMYKGDDGFEAGLSVVLMGTDRTSIHKPQYCLLGQGWQIESSEVVSIPMRKPYPYDLKAMRLNISTKYKGENVHGIYLYWFVADGKLTPSHGQRMWWMAWDLLTTGRLQRWAYVSCLSACNPGREKVLFERMKSFISEAVPEFQLVAGQKTLVEANPLRTALVERP